MTKREIKQLLLNELYAPYTACTKCPLGLQGRTQVVFGRGNPDASLLIIGEGPGKDEDLQGVPFVGRSGQLLTKTLSQLGLTPEQYYITNIVKCRPPANRTPTPQEASVCTNLLLVKQIEIIAPKLICPLGSSATTLLLQSDEKISDLRGKIHPYNTISVLPTYHPAYILRDPNKLPTFKADLHKAEVFINSNKKIIQKQ